MPEENLQGLLAEMDAQGAAERAVAGTGSPEEALVAVEGALDLLPEPESLGDRVCRAAMMDLLRRTSREETGEPVASPPEDHLFESVALAWMAWLQGRRGRLDRLLAQNDPDSSREGAVHRMALLYWRDAVRLFVQGERDESRRVWQRALEVGSSIGTESHPVILWTFIATFFPKPGQSRPLSPSVSLIAEG